MLDSSTPLDLDGYLSPAEINTLIAEESNILEEAKQNITLLRLNHHLAKLYSNRASLQKVRSNAMQELSTIHQPMDSAQFFLEIVAEFQLRLAKYDIDHEKD